MVAGIQAAAGPVSAQSAVAYLQSAAMGGYGVAAVNTVTNVSAGILGAAVGFFNVTVSAVW